MEGSTDLNEDNTLNLANMDNARAHRGFLRGDFLVVGYTYTPNWGRGNPDRYDFFVRRSFDGGKKWTNANGKKEDPRNLSNIKEEGNRGWSVMEPRLYATPGTIKSDGKVSLRATCRTRWSFSCLQYDTQPTRISDVLGGGQPGEKDQPLDLYWTMTDNFGESYKQEWNSES